MLTKKVPEIQSSSKMVVTQFEILLCATSVFSAVFFRVIRVFRGSDFQNLSQAIPRITRKKHRRGTTEKSKRGHY
jgi:hypothetical protein